MQGTTLAKLARLAAHLARRPRDIPRYLSQGPLQKDGPLDLGLPWVSFAAIDFLAAFVQPSMRVFEYGSGGSTVFFARRATEVVSTEDHPGWRDRVQARLDADGLRNVTLQYRPFDFVRAEGFAGSGYLHSIPEGRFDVIMVDGTEYDVPVRPDCFFHAEDFVAPGGVIVVDDAWRYPHLRDGARARSFTEFRSAGPCRPGVTTTEVFFY